jgi:NAD(P)-dependent dehydrogenase (short-subunit alcohol dehydrogenase family)
MQGRVVLITGASRGIGRAIALAFGVRGARIALAARGLQDLQQVVQQAEANNTQAVAFEADLADRSAPVRLVRDVERDLGEIDILINNAGQGSADSPRPVADYDDDFWDRSLMINLTVPYLLSKAVLPAMLKKKWGRIINIGSIMSKVPGIHMAAYVASKHGLLGFTRSLALEVAKNGISVNCICPGSTHTDMSDRRLRYNAQIAGKSFNEVERDLTPMGRRVEPEEIAALAVFLASDEASSVTGQAYNVDCGQVMF